MTTDAAPGNLSGQSSGLLTEKQLADRLHISIRHLANLRKAGLPYFQLGASLRYDVAEVEAYLRSNRRLSSHVERQKRRAAIGARNA